MTSPRASDPYRVLGIAAHASQEQIRHAYRELLRRHHPDSRAPGDELRAQAHDDALRRVIAAYALLDDPDRRAAYDGRQQHDLDAAPRPPSIVHRHHEPPIKAGPLRWTPP